MCRRDEQLRSLTQKRVAHVHVVKQHQRTFCIANILDRITDRDFIGLLGAGDHAREHQLAFKNACMVHNGLDPDRCIVFIPQQVLCRRVGDASVQRQRLALILTGASDRVKSAGRQKARRKVFEPSGILIIVIGRRRITAGREKSIIIALEAESRNIGAAIC